MSDMHVRNLRAAWAGNYNSPEVYMFILREALLAAGWQIIDDQSLPAYTDPANVLLELTDVELDSAKATEVYSVTGGFTAGMEGKAITIYTDLTAAGQTNRGVYNIKRVIDTNTLLIDQRCRTAAWADQTGVSVKIHNCGTGVFLGHSRTLVYQPPVASGINVQYRTTISSDGQYHYEYCYPLGNYGGGNTVTASHLFMWTYNSLDMRFNICLSDGNESHFRNIWYCYNSAGWRGGCFGKLSQAAAGDPAFFVQRLVDQSQSYTWATGMEHDIKMINELGAQINGAIMYYKDGLNVNISACRERQSLAKLINGTRAKTFRPLVLMENSPEGGFVRGVMPQEFKHASWPDMSEFGTDYWSTGYNILVPRNGAADTVPLASTAA